MSEQFQIIKYFYTNNPDLVTWGVAGIILVFGVLMQLSKIREYISEWKLNYLLKNIGDKVLHNVTIADGMEGNIFIEYLILTSNKIFLLGVKKYKGLIFAAEKIDLWTQVVGNKSYKFNNPLLQLENDALALKSIIESSAISEKVLFINGSEFPKGKPDNIVSVEDVKKWNKNSTESIPKPLTDDWEKLSALAVSNDFTKSVLTDDDDSSSSGVFSLIVTIITVLLWLAWRLL